jgi:hypothetical protein
MTAKFMIACGGSGVYVLGQRRTLGLRGEMQIDVKKEIESTTQKLAQMNDPYFFQVRADIAATNVKALFEAIPEIAKNRGWDKHIKDHALFISENWIKNAALVDGLAQSPAIGGLAIQHPKAQDELRNGIENMLKPIDAGQDLEFWIISSTAGGTGEGIHRAVAEKIIEVVQSKNYNSLKIKFIRIGTSTYQKITGDRGAVSTFFGLAADSIFENEMGRKYQGKAATINWFYVDFPDYGEGDDAKAVRGPVIELGAKALMLDELANDLDKLGVNANIIICRVGFWGKVFADADLYAAALRGLLQKLEQFIRPNDNELTPDGMEPRFSSGGLDSKIVLLSKEEILIERLDTGWQFGSSKIPEDFNNLDQFLKESENDIAKLLNEESFSYRGFNPISQYSLSYIKENAPQEVKFESSSQAENIGSIKWFDTVQRAQSVRAWSLKLLGIRWLVKPETTTRRSKLIWYTENGLLAQLFKAYDNCLKVIHTRWYKNTSILARELDGKLRVYIPLLVQVRILFDELENSLKLLNSSVAEADKMVRYAKERLKYLDSEPDEAAPIVVASLKEELDALTNTTWFKLIYDEVIQTRPESFRREVLRGAVGLTKRGLKDVLGIGISANSESIKTELRENVGRMHLPDNETEVKALWFGGRDPRQKGKNKFFFRMLPKLEEGFDLGFTKEGDLSLVYPKLGILGLKVLALEGVTIAEQTDAITTHAWLAESYTGPVKKLLANWSPHVRGKASSRLQIATSTVVGDPLSEEVLLGAGLDANEISRLKDYLYIKSFVNEISKEETEEKNNTITPDSFQK